MLHFFGKRLAELHEKDRNERGFTLIELLVVIIIIGILAAIAIPAFLAQRERAQVAMVESDLRNAGTAYNTCIADLSTFTSCDTVGEIDGYGFNPSADVTFTNPFGGSANAVSIAAAHADNAAVDGTFTGADGRVLVNTTP